MTGKKCLYEINRKEKTERKKKLPMLKCPAAEGGKRATLYILMICKML